MKIILRFLTFITIVLSPLSQAVALPGPIINAQWLANNLPDVQVLEVTRDPANFIKTPTFEVNKLSGKKALVEVGGHIKGSLLMNSKDLWGERMLNGQRTKFLIPEWEDFQSLVQSVGIESSKPIIIVPMGQDMSDVDDGLRAYWQFKVYGEANIAVLDGGLAGWIADGHSISSAAVPKNQGDWMAKTANQDLMANTSEVIQASKSGDIQLIDSRQPSQYLGVTKKSEVAGYGHIQGAKMFSPELMSRSENGAVYFLKPFTYLALLEANGIRPREPAISYCNTGHLASGSWFIISEILGNPYAKLYDGSTYLWTKEGNKLEGVPLN